MVMEWVTHGSARLAASALVLVLAGCSLSASLTVEPDQLAATAADALEPKMARRPHITCGTGVVPLKVGTKVHCEVTDPTTLRLHDATVEITRVDGTKYTVSVTVAETPKG